NELRPPVLQLPRRRAGEPHRLRHRLEQHLGLKGLGQKRKHPPARRHHRLRNRAVRRQNHHRQRRRITVDRIKQRHPVHPRHPQVGHHHLRARHRQRRERRLPGLHRRHRIPRRRQPHPHQLQQVPVIVHQENLGILATHGYTLLSPRRGKVTRKCPPAPPATTAIWPPCASTSSRAIARPMPLPLTPVSALVLPRKNRLKIDSRSSSGTPGPESMTSITASPARALA